MKFWSFSTWLAVLLTTGTSSFAAEVKETTSTCRNAYAVLGWSRFDAQEQDALEKLAHARIRMGEVQERIGEPCAAFASYQSVVALEGRGVDAKVSEARMRLSALEPQVRSTLRLDVTAIPREGQSPVKPKESELEVTLDGVRVGAGTLSLAAGNHRITVGAKGYATYEESLSTCKEERVLALTLQPATTSPSPTTASAGAAAVSPKPPAKPAGGDDDDEDGDGDDDRDDDTKSTEPASTAGAPSAAEAASAVVAQPAPSSPGGWKGTLAQRRELAKWRIAASDWQKAADFWSASKKIPWNKVGWILGRRRYLKHVDEIEPGVARQVTFRQYSVRGQDRTYAYVARCGTGGTCNEIAKVFFYMYKGVGVPQVECAALSDTLVDPTTPEIVLPTAEEIAERDAEFLAENGGGDDDDDDDDKADAGKVGEPKKGGGDDDDDDDDDDD